MDCNNNAQWLQWTMNNDQWQWPMITMTMNNDYNDNEQWQQWITITTMKFYCNPFLTMPTMTTILTIVKTLYCILQDCDWHCRWSSSQMDCEYCRQSASARKNAAKCIKCTYLQAAGLRWASVTCMLHPYCSGLPTFTVMCFQTKCA